MSGPLDELRDGRDPTFRQRSRDSNPPRPAPRSNPPPPVPRPGPHQPPAPLPRTPSIAPKLIIGAAILAMAVIAALIFGDSNGTHTAAPTTNGGAASSGGESSVRPDRPSVNPPTIATPDPYGHMCIGGYQVSGQSGWGSHSARGSVETSCAFAESVLNAYWTTYGAPSEVTQEVIAAGTVPCPTTGGRCSGDNFVMSCGVQGSDPWITCTGGRNARVYLY